MSSSFARLRGAFTLVELLIVLVIIGMLVALTFPAINAARETGRQASCLNKMAELGKAVAQFHEAQLRYPGWQEVIQARSANGNATVYYPLSWTGAVVQYLERRDVAETFKSPNYTGGTAVAFLVNIPNLNDKLACPSDVAKSNASGWLTSYVANCGRRDVFTTSGSAPYPPRDWRSNAVFLDMRGDADYFPPGANYLAPWPNDNEQKSDNSFIQKNDGLTQTVMLSENLDGMEWYNLAMTSNFGASHLEYFSGFLFYPPAANGSAPDPAVQINGPRHPTDPFLRARPSSNHRGGVNAVFCDGSGRFLSNSIAYRVYCAIMTPAGVHAREPGSSNATVNTFITNPGPLIGEY